MSLAFNGTEWAPGIANSNAIQIQYRPIDATAPTTGAALVWDGTNWAPADVNAVKLQGQLISQNAPASGNLLRFNGTDWAPFDGIAVPNWNNSTFYFAGDYVFYIGKIWFVTATAVGVAPNGIESAFAELLGVSNGVPQETATPAFWRYINTPSGAGYIPIFQ